MTSDKFLRLGPRLLGKECSNAQSSLESLEQVVPVSNRYREVLLAFGGAVVFDNGAKIQCDERSPLNDKKGFQSIEVLFGLGNGQYSIRRKIGQYAGELPVSFVPIGESGGGNLICADGKGAVHLWDHESRPNERTWRIAASLDKFLKRLEPDNSGIGSTDGIIESESFLDF